MKHRRTTTFMPWCECPSCCHWWQIDDWYDLGDGDTIECPRCGAKIEIVERETRVRMTFDAKVAGGEA